MTIFAILMPTPQPGIEQEIMKIFPNDFLKLNETQWLVSGVGTAIDISGKLGIHRPTGSTEAPTGSAVVLATSSYFGRAPSNVWDWFKVKLETPPSA